MWSYTDSTHRDVKTVPTDKGSYQDVSAHKEEKEDES